MAAIDDLISDILGSRYSDSDQNIIAKVNTMVLALQQIQQGILPASAGANLVFAGPNGAPGAPTFRALVAADINGLSLTLAGLVMSVGATITPAQLAGIVGTTAANNAQAGSVGEEIESVVLQGAAAALTTGTPLTITSITPTAGDWDVYGSMGFTGNAATTVTDLNGSLSPVTNAAAQQGNFARTDYGFPTGTTLFANANPGMNMGPVRMSIGAPTTMFLVAAATFGVNSCSAWGAIRARRIR